MEILFEPISWGLLIHSPSPDVKSSDSVKKFSRRTQTAARNFEPSKDLKNEHLFRHSVFFNYVISISMYNFLVLVYITEMLFLPGRRRKRQKGNCGKTSTGS